MVNHRVLLYITLFFITYLIWAQWQMDYGPKPVVVTNDVAFSDQKSAGIIPEALAVTDGADNNNAITEERVDSQRIHIITDVIDVEIDTRGGDIKKLVLLNYLESADNKEIRFIC